MNISYQWLKEFLPLTLSAQETAEKLTSLGLEVGTVEDVESIKGGLKGLVVAEVLSCEAHPNSDHLHITTVNYGADQPVQVVCGAPNVRQGLKTIMATLGTTLYSGDESFTIKKSKIRGVESFGMLCAEDEIGIGASHDGIIELPSDAVVGTPASQYYQIESDSIIEVDITPNRSDAISHYGVARDLAAALQLPLNRPSVDNFAIDNQQHAIAVEVRNPQACPRYTGLTISGITVKESPNWLKNKLNAIGLRPINNVVDITNYVLHEIGQPLHAFDADQIAGGRIIVQTLPEGTPFVTLDEVERKLSANDLVICNEKEAMCLAGVFGGLKSGVTENTRNLFIESAYFNPVSIRKTARRHGLNTDASFRYERGCDPNICLYALKRAALLIKELAGGSISSEITDIYPQPIKDAVVKLSYQKVNSLIGKEIDKATVRQIVTGLEMQILEENNEELTLAIPPYRADVTRDVDVIEDILRVYGYNNIQPGQSLKSSISYSSAIDCTRLQNRISCHLSGAGFSEILNNSLTKVSYYQNLSSFPESQAVRIINPLGSDLSVMRQTLLFGGLESIARNRNHRISNLRFYEFGQCYHFLPEKKRADYPLAAYSEEMHLGIWMCGDNHESDWNESCRHTNFFDLKAYVIQVLNRLGITPAKYRIQDYSCDLYRAALQFCTPAGKVLATLGILKSAVCRNFDIDTDVFYADLEWKNILKSLKGQNITCSDIAKFPEVKRDLALLIDQTVKFETIEKIAYETEKQLLKKVSLFDVYEGKNLEAGKKSYAVSFTLQDTEKTLTDERIDKIMQQLINNFQTKIGAKIR